MKVVKSLQMSDGTQTMTAQIIRGTPRYLKLAPHAADRVWLKDFFKLIFISSAYQGVSEQVCFKCQCLTLLRIK